jgi:formamidopyrimidine-DNA glycosylase
MIVSVTTNGNIQEKSNNRNSKTKRRKTIYWSYPIRKKIMPELPEVETIVKALAREMTGEKFTKIATFIEVIRYPLTLHKEPELLNSVIVTVRRRARYIIIELANQHCVVIHLGMSGSIRIVPQNEPRKKHEHVLFYLSNGDTMRFDCPRRFGFIKTCILSTAGAQPPFLADLGLEPLSPKFTGRYFKTQTAKRRGAVKNLLMNNSIVVGVGNIYVAEAMFAAGVRPDRLGISLTETECNKLVKEVKKVLCQSIKAGGTTFSDYRQVDGSEGKFVRELKIYGRAGQPCVKCKTEIVKSTIGGRSSFTCPNCQK